MKIHRFILLNFEFREKLPHIYDREFFNQVINVLKLKAGEKIIISDGKNNEALFEITNFGKNFVSIKMIEKTNNENEPDIYLTLYCSILKKENFELICQKATEIGVKEITPVITSRTIKTGFNKTRLEKIIKEAAEQSGRSMLPALNEPKIFSEAVEQANGNNETNFLFDREGKSFGKNYSNKKAGLFIGPEGGFTKEEKELVENYNFQTISLGKLTLRAETAAVIASYLAIM